MTQDDPHQPAALSARPAILLLADGPVGAGIARFLLSSHRDDLLAIVLPAESELHGLAGEHGVMALVHDTDEAVAARIPQAPALGVAAGWRSIIRQPLLGLPTRGFVNLHPGLLPQSRGKNPNFWALAEGKPYGVTLHQVDAGIDTGPILAEQRIPYDWTDTGESLFRKAIDAMVDLFRKAYPALRRNALAPVMQGPGGSTRYRRDLDPASHIDLDRSYTARQLLNLLRARSFAPHPGCSFEDDGESFEVRVTITRRTPNPSE